MVAVLDTGCGTHPWLNGVVKAGPPLDSSALGYVDGASDPEKHPDQTGPLDGSIDDLSGHGTFICGLVHQACPDADIFAWRIVASNGIVVESDLVMALKGIAELARRHRDDEDGGQPIDVLNLSMGYYHESPEDLKFDSTMSDVLKVLGDVGVSVICSAGNEGGTTPMFPAAFTPWTDGNGPYQADVGTIPIVSVAALNPNGSDALFTNVGPWVRAREKGASVLSTSPPFQGGLEPVARTAADGHTRETIDPDDYTGSFAIWSGTSFAAPIFAGRVAAGLAAIPGDRADDGRAVARQRAWPVVTALTGIQP